MCHGVLFCASNHSHYSVDFYHFHCVVGIGPWYPNQKAFLVPIFVLQAPLSVVSWIKGDYGLWTAFLALLTRLFFSIPAELELPLATFLVVVVIPYEIMKFRGSKESAVLSLLLAGYSTFEHFKGTGSFKKAFGQGSIVATLSVICITLMSLLLLV